MISEIKDVFDKINKDRYVIGYDLNNEFAQISYCKIDSTEPETLSVVAGQDMYNIPAAVCKRTSTGAWIYGKEAIKAGEEGDGAVLKNLLSKAVAGQNVSVGQDEYRAEDLLLLFVKRCFSLLPVMTTPDKVAQIFITVREAGADTIRILQKIPEKLRINPDKVHFINYEESFYYYMMYQPKELKNNQILLCDTSEKVLNVYRLEKNKFSNPPAVAVERQEFEEFSFKEDSMFGRDDRDRDFLKIVTALCEKNIFSGVFLIGEGFYDDWCVESLKFLCKNRRVFKGNNLFSKGACIAAREAVNPSEVSKNTRFLGTDRVKATVGVKASDGSKEEYLKLIETGSHWYESGNAIEVLLKEEDILPIWIEKISSRGMAVADFKLEGLNVKPGVITRVSVSLKMKNESIAEIKVKDLGFGNFFPSSGLEWTEEMDLS